MNQPRRTMERLEERTQAAIQVTVQLRRGLDDAEMLRNARLAVARLQFVLETDVRALQEELVEGLTQATCDADRQCLGDSLERLGSFRKEASALLWELVPSIQTLARSGRR